MTNKELTRQEVADIFGVTPQTISNWVEKGLLEGVKTKAKVFISKASVDNLLVFSKEIGDHENEIEEYRKELLQKRKELKGSSVQACDNITLRHNIDRLTLFFVEAFTTLSKECEFSERAKEITRKYLKGVDINLIAQEYGLSGTRVSQIAHKSIRRIGQFRNYAEMKRENKGLRAEVAFLANENKRLQDALTNERLIVVEGDADMARLSSKAIKTLLKPVGEVGLSRRTYNCLRAADIDYIYQLVQKSRQYLMRCRNFGRKSLNEIDIFMDSNNLWFNMNPTLIAKVLEKYNL